MGNFGCSVSHSLHNSHLLGPFHGHVTMHLRIFVLFVCALMFARAAEGNSNDQDNTQSEDSSQLVSFSNEVYCVVCKAASGTIWMQRQDAHKQRKDYNGGIMFPRVVFE